MLITLVLILLFIILGILVSIYSVFGPFIQNIGNVTDFNSAYYGALAGLERAELVLKYKHPGFEGSGGFFGSSKFGPESDKINGNFGLLTQGNNGVSWDISSRTKSIPGSGNGNVDYLLAGPDSSNYNQLPYFSSEKIIFSIDTTNQALDYYSSRGSSQEFNGGVFSGIIRIPPKVLNAFGDSLLCDDKTMSQCDPDGDGLADDSIVNWSIEGMNNGNPFTILPNISVLYYNDMEILPDEDTAIRKSIINETGYLGFGLTNTYWMFNPILNRSINTLTEHNVISTDPDSIKNLSFRSIFSNDLITGIKLSLNIIKVLFSKNNNIYPFLEYKIMFPNYVSDRFFTLQGKGLVGQYNVKIFIKKPTNEGQSSIGDFTVIF